MCGIVGFYSKDEKYTLHHLKEMTDMISHRGPDADGHYNDDHCFLGHRRLSILDTTENGNQPFYSKCGRYIMVFNGEVYNFNEIAKKYNFELKTSSDTEVILELFVEKGNNFVNELNGMFSICIYDKLEGIVSIFRDRLGIKPLFYYHDETLFAFSSELKSLKKILHKKLTIDKDAISNFLYQGYIPEPLTIYKEVRKFPSGSVGRLINGKLTIQQYWNTKDQIKSKTFENEREAKKTLNDLLESSINYRMISDVPLGTFLSGGTDSSLVTALAQKNSEKPIKTFSIGFKEAKYNESEHAKEVAKYLHTDHHEFILSEKEAIDEVDKLLSIYDEPFADSSAIPTLLVSQMARKEVTVTLSGDGGDELFMGYGMYEWANRLSKPLLKTFRKPIAGLLNLRGNREKRAAKVFNYPTEKDIKSHIFSQEQYLFSKQEIKELVSYSYDLSLNEEFTGLNRKLSAREEQAFFDLNNYLKDDLLIKVDRASMHHSLETRVPLLDHRIVEFALNLSENLKVKQGTQKYLLKQVLYDYIPESIMDRPKWGFSIPLQNWLQKDLSYLIDMYLNKALIEEFNVVDYNVVENLVFKFNNGDSFLYNRLWVLILLHKWLKDNE